MHSTIVRGMKIVCASTKGGTAKTTTAVLLAEAAAANGQDAMVIDLDAQQSGGALAWAEHAAEDEPLRSPVSYTHLTLPTIYSV